METRNKSMVTYSLDREVLEAFEKFCASGERSATVNELIKDFLQKQYKMPNQREGLETEKELLSKRIAEIQGKQDELDATSKRLLLQREAELQVRARKMEGQKVRDDRMFKARQLAYQSIGLFDNFPISEMDIGTKDLFGKRTREFYERLEKEELK